MMIIRLRPYDDDDKKKGGKKNEKRQREKYKISGQYRRRLTV